MLCALLQSKKIVAYINHDVDVTKINDEEKEHLPDSYRKVDQIVGMVGEQGLSLITFIFISLFWLPSSVSYFIKSLGKRFS